MLGLLREVRYNIRMKITNLREVLADQKPYRRKQSLKAVFVDLIDDWQQATTLSVDLREQLNEECSLDINAQMFESKDGHTVKALLILEDGKKIETVLMQHKDDRNTVCVSSQVGCPMGCLFCATGQMGFTRDLTVDEIIAQVILFARYLKKQSKKITNVVYMGMGEPFLNYDNVIESIRILNSPEGFELGARKIAVSTVGIISAINKFAEEDWQVNLAISLHAPNSGLRSKLMPANLAHPLDKLLSAVDRYIEKTSRRVMFEYLMIKGVNDSPQHAKELAGILNKPLYLVNLIRYNDTGKYSSSDTDTINQFMKVLQHAGVPVTQRYSYGQDINAACGQLATQKSKK